MLIAVITSLVGAVGGIAQTQFRSLLAYSSLGQAGWIVIISLFSVELFLIYVLLYSLLLSGLLCGLNRIRREEVTKIVG